MITILIERHITNKTYYLVFRFSGGGGGVQQKRLSFPDSGKYFKHFGKNICVNTVGREFYRTFDAENLGISAIYGPILLNDVLVSLLILQPY